MKTTPITPKLDTLTVGQLLDDAFELTRCQSTRHPTNVIEIRLTTRGLEVETTPDKELTDRIETLERELEESEYGYKCSEKENNELRMSGTACSTRSGSWKTGLRNWRSRSPSYKAPRHPFPLS